MWQYLWLFKTSTPHASKFSDFFLFLMGIEYFGLIEKLHLKHILPLQKNNPNYPLADPSNVNPPLLDINLGLMTNFVNAMNGN